MDAKNEKAKKSLLSNQLVIDFLPSIVIIILLTVGGNILSPGFASANNMLNILARACVLAVACIGQAFVMISGNAGIDMSIGAVMSMACLVGPIVSGGNNAGLILSVLAFIVIGTIIGVINGVCIQFLKIPSLVMTLAMSAIVSGLTLGITRGQPIMTIPPILLELGMPVFLQIRAMTFAAAVIIAIMMFVLHKTGYGKSLFIVGSNRNAARLSGIRVHLIVIGAYVVSAIISGIAGLMLVGYVGSAQLQMASSYTLLSVAAVVIGGTKLSGGKGGLIGGLLGSLVLLLLTSILTALGLPDGVRQLIQGALLLMVLLINSREAKLRV
jgi:ribose transport system permease protein